MLQIIIHGCDGSIWIVHGDGAGREGVRLGKDQVKGLFAAPVRTAWKAGARQSGGAMKGMWHDWRDLSLGFHVVAGRNQETVMSKFRQAFDYREDEWDWDARLARIEVRSDLSTRSLDVQLYEKRDFDPGVDPLVTGHGNPILPLRAGQPFWYEDDEIATWSTASTSGSGYVKVHNPTDTVMRHKWILTRGQWTLPDFSWEGPPGERRFGVSKLTGRDDRNRTILMPDITAVQGGAVVDLDPMKLMVRDAHDTNILGQMPVPGRYFEYSVPPKTPPTNLPVSVTNAPSGVGAMVQLVQPRRWLEAIGGQ
jgi:hypothetical protein